MVKPWFCSQGRRLRLEISARLRASAQASNRLFASAPHTQTMSGSHKLRKVSQRAQPCFGSNRKSAIVSFVSSVQLESAVRVLKTAAGRRDVVESELERLSTILSLKQQGNADFKAARFILPVLTQKALELVRTANNRLSAVLMCNRHQQKSKWERPRRQFAIALLLSKNAQTI